VNERERELRGPDLPVRLRDLPSPPNVVFVRGELPRGPAVAIVGTRYPIEAALAFTSELVSDLVAAGVAILSGGARGIDGQAHRAALESGGNTVVVAPSGFDRPYPREHAELFHTVVANGGAYLSLVPAHVRPTQGAFHVRNAALVALAHAVVVVQAGQKSGALSAASAARRIRRPLFVVPAAPWDPLSAGCLSELERGARVLRGAGPLLRLLADQRLYGARRMGADTPLGGPQNWGVAPEESGTMPRAFTADEERGILLDLLRFGAAHPDALAVATGWPVQRIQQLLLTLTLDGVVVSDPSGWLTLLK
jgi:DNA processing protein